MSLRILLGVRRVRSQFSRNLRLLLFLVFRDIQSRYKGTTLGLFWSLLNPVVTLFIFWLIFSHLTRGNIPHFPLFLAIGYIPWHFLQNAVFAATPSLVSFSPLVRNLSFPKQVIPVAEVASNFVNSFILGILILVPFCVAYGIEIRAPVLIIPLLGALLFVFVCGIALSLSCLQVFFRDTRVLVGHVLQFWFFLTPIFYSPAIIPAQFQWVLQANPMARMIEGFRQVLLASRWPSVPDLAILLLFSTASLGLGLAAFRHYEPYLAEEV